MAKKIFDSDNEKLRKGDKYSGAAWCAECNKNHWDLKIICLSKQKKGSYHPYRDTLDSEPYYYNIATVKCPECGSKVYIEVNNCYYIEETDMEKYGYHGANYGS